MIDQVSIELKDTISRIELEHRKEKYIGSARNKGILYNTKPNIELNIKPYKL